MIYISDMNVINESQLNIDQISLTNTFKTFIFNHVKFSLYIKKEFKLLKFETTDNILYFGLFEFFIIFSKCIPCIKHYKSIIRDKAKCNCLFSKKELTHIFNFKSFKIELYINCSENKQFTIDFFFKNRQYFCLDEHEINIVMTSIRPFFITQIIKNEIPFVYMNQKRNVFLNLVKLMNDLMLKSSNTGKIC